ncbi:hypothetical protein N7522_006865 [Penicillium canescens]|nr:hypothetical protein N7522_006865 [Penicillium canescens]KAJ6159158.1 hypothetical protein N7485_011984 [Penicillium canescens]
MAQSAEFNLFCLRKLPDELDVIGAHFPAQRPQRFVLKGRSPQRNAPTSEIPLSPSLSRTYCHEAALMAAEPNAPGHNKQYYEEEEHLLISLKQLGGLSWPEIALRFNESVPDDRHRTASALENKWRQLRKTHQ